MRALADLDHTKLVLSATLVPRTITLRAVVSIADTSDQHALPTGREA